MATYESNINQIQNALTNFLKAIRVFGKRVYWARAKEITRFPSLRIFLVNDAFTPLGPKHTLHELEFQIEINHRAKITEETLDQIINYAGLIVDKLESDRTLSEACRNLEVLNVRYEYRSTESFIFHYALIALKIEVEW